MKIFLTAKGLVGAFSGGASIADWLTMFGVEFSFSASLENSEDFAIAIELN